MATSVTPNFSCCLHATNSSREIPQITMLNLSRITTSFPTERIEKCRQAPTQAPLCAPLKHFSFEKEDPSFADDIHVEHAQKLEVFKRILKIVGEDPYEGLAMIDAIQRLGIDHHFQDEITQILQNLYMRSASYPSPDQDLHQVALRFRLLRQEGYPASASVFNNFRDKDGKFQRKLSKDIKGLIELYEASQLDIKGEDLLDEAGRFSAQLLHACSANLDPCQARLVRYSLDHPYHKSLSRFTAKKFLSDYHGKNGWIQTLQELAKTDFNLVQSLHQKEIAQVSRWWNDVGLGKELKFARDQPLKWHLWSTACLTDPALSEERIDLTKPISFIYIIDDIFDIYGNLEELTLFTDVVDRWDYDNFQQLSHEMKLCFEALDNVTNEISFKFYKKHGWNPVNYLRKTWRSLCKAFLVEAKWFACGHSPKPDEYLKNAIVSTGVHVVIVHMFFLLGQGITKENLKLINNTPGLMSFTATILRLWDDLGSAKDENQDGYDGSYLEYYMKEHGSTVDDARKQVISLISDAWKGLNQECLYPNPFSASLTRACLNLARMVPLMYSYDENHGLPSLDEYMRSLLYENAST